MYIRDDLVRHELNRIHAIRVNRPDVIMKAKAKVELLHDLDLINIEQLAFELDRLDALERDTSLQDRD